LEFRNIVAVKAPPGVNSGWKIETDWPVYRGINQPGFYYFLSYGLSHSISAVSYRGNIIYNFKGLVHCFSMQDVIMNKCFLLSPEKKFGADSSFCFQEKRKNC